MLTTGTPSLFKEGTWIGIKIYGGKRVAILLDSGEIRREVCVRSRCYIEERISLG